MFTYYLKEDLQTAGQQRQDADREANDAGADAPYPGFDALREERLEDGAAIVFTVRDTNGELVRRIEGETGAGFHRTAWDLRYAESSAWKPEAGEAPYIPSSGPLAAPGNYSVTMSKRLGGVETQLADPVNFEVESIVESALQGANPDEMVAFGLRVDDLRRSAAGMKSAITTALVETGAMKDTVLRSTADADLRGKVLATERTLQDLEMRLSGDKVVDRMNADRPMPLADRLNRVSYGVRWATYGPTPNHTESLAIAEAGLDDLAIKLTAVLETDLPTLRAELDAAGVPWTPGRGAIRSN